MPGLRDIGNKNVKFASFGGTGTTSIVAAVSGKKIAVVSFLVTGTANSTMTFKSATTAITGDMNLVSASLQLVGPYNPDAHFQTASGEALQITASAGTAAGYVTYFEC
jgi:hypothetical protein